MWYILPMPTHHRLRSVAKFFGILGLVYVSLFTIDALTLGSTTDSERARAMATAAAQSSPLPPRPFYFDGCTGFPDWLPFHNFYEACLNHDIAYWLGGSEADRLETNRRFAEAMKESGPLGWLLSPVTYYAMHYGGNNFMSQYVLGSNWGFGWNTTDPWLR